MIILHAALCAAVVPFEEIGSQTIRLAALFIDSSKENKDVIRTFEKFEVSYPDTKFYIIDK